MQDELTRRDFLRAGADAALASGLAAGSARGERTQTSSQKYEVEVPDTLDLAERGALALNALTGSADTGHYYETYHGGHLDQQPPYLSHGAGGPCGPKAVHALPLMRVMSGSKGEALRLAGHCLIRDSVRLEA